MSKLTKPFEQQIAAEKKYGKHTRNEKLQNTVNTILRVAIISAPILAVIWYAVILVHNISINDWSSINTDGSEFVKVIGAFLIGLLNNNLSEK